jgi:hypothetical protein
MYIANETVVVVGKPEEIADEVAKRIVDGWNVDNVFKRGDDTHARFTRESAPPESGKDKK